MPNIQNEINQIKNAVYGEEVRESIIGAIKKVNDDNESYETIKVELKGLKTDLDNSKATLESIKSATNTASTTKANLDTSTSKATQAKKDLDSSITDATSEKKALDTSVSTANTSKSNLDKSVTSGNSAKTELDKFIESAKTNKTNLDSSNTTATNTLNSLKSENTKAQGYLNQVTSEKANQILNGISDVKDYLGLVDTQVVGLQVDYKNRTFKRLCGAVGLNKGSDFNKFKMYGGRRRCNVADDGTIKAYYGDSGYKEDGSNGQVMVYQPKFYYNVVPVETEQISTTKKGYHMRKANYYVSDVPKPNFKVHPVFFDKNGKETDYVLLSAFEGSLYDTSASKYLANDEQVADFSADKLCSIANVRPISGLSQDLTRPKTEQLAKNRGDGWHQLNIKMTSMEQLLMMIELGTMDVQSAIGQGVTSIPDNGSTSCASYTGSTSSLGNSTGMASATKDHTGTSQTANGKVAISYRGVENFYGSIWKFASGMNIYGNGKMDGGMAYICNDFAYAEGKNTGNYKPCGFTLTPKGGFISAMGYSEEYDWLFLASECNGNSALPVGDYTWVTENLNGYRIALLGGGWDSGGTSGAFYWFLTYGVGSRYRFIGGRLSYIPTMS